MYFPLTHIFYFDCKFLLTHRGVNMDNLAIKSILILMFVLIISKILDGAYSTMNKGSADRYFQTKQKDKSKYAREIINEDATSDEEE